ncbi:MAG: putative ATP-grasp-modified RiPP [Pseudonocardiaceae bacterium]
MSDQVPLGRRHDLVTPTAAVSSSPELRPFGLRFATAETSAVVIDVTGVRYDAERQVSVDVTGTPACRHTDGKTSTKTSDGHKSMDSDEDARED